MRLTKERRKHLKKSVFGLPGKKNAKGGKGSYPMPDKEHARLAISGASHAERVGNISKAQQERIDAKARRILNGGKKDRDRRLSEEKL